jgi:hypothetical protein
MEGDLVPQRLADILADLPNVIGVQRAVERLGVPTQQKLISVALTASDAECVAVRRSALCA